MEDSSFILDQLAKASVYHITKSDHCLIRCPVHNSGQERTPSRKISFGSKFPYGESYCFACQDSDKKLSWNQLAAKLNMLPLRGSEDTDGDEENQLFFSLPSMQDFYGTEAKALSRFPWKGPWRGINASLMKKAGAVLVNSADEPRVLLPILIDGEEVGFTECTIDPKSDAASKVKYLHSGKWTNWALYPVDIAFPMAEKLGYILVVEGSRDALNLIQYGVPAVSICGTNNYTRAKRDTLIDLGVKVVIAMDDDEPGHKCRDKIKADFERSKHPHAVINFTDGGDPGQLKKPEVLEIAEMLGGKRSKRINIKEMLTYWRELRAV